MESDFKKNIRKFKVRLNKSIKGSKMKTKKLCMSGICLTLCMLLPFLTGQIPYIGSALSPMHIPVLVCGLLCGGIYGAAIGFIAPLLRFLLFGMPPIFPIGVAMTFELAAYGMISGVMYHLLPKKKIHLYTSLIGAMLIGRGIWGLIRWTMALLFGIEFSWQMFVSGAFITAIPGMICHILIIPILVMVFQKIKDHENQECGKEVECAD